MARPPPSGLVPPLDEDARRISLSETYAAAPDPRRLNVFAYGSLIWSPCFNVVDRRAAVLRDFRRDCSIWSVLARGTPDRPGLGFALEASAGAACHGVLYRLPDTTTQADLVPLWEREMWTDAYSPQWVEVSAEGAEEPALTFVLRPDHPQYAGGLSIAEKAGYIERAHGKYGPCRDMVLQTAAALRDLGISDPDLEALAAALTTPPG